MDLKRIKIGVDGETVDLSTIREFNLDYIDNVNSKSRHIPAIKQDSYGNYKYNFVGYVFSKNKILAVFPKNYIPVYEYSNITQFDLTLLSSVLIKYNRYYLSNNKSQDDNFESTFPFTAYYGIFDYFIKYGIYSANKSVVVGNSNGKILWKDTIQKSNQYISNGSIIFSPLYTKKNNNYENFVSECMKFVIHYTSTQYGFIISKTHYFKDVLNFDFILHRDYVINELNKAKLNSFKDIHKQLIDNLIDFFRSIKLAGQGLFRHYKFNHVWEDMVGHYLNNYFQQVDNNHGVIFNAHKEPLARKFSKIGFTPGIGSNNQYINLYPDHYLQLGDNQYIFDSKYYSKIDNLDHKQMVYFMLLRHRSNQTFNALFIPTFKSTYNELHIKLFDEFNLGKGESDKLVIWNTYLNVISVMKNYIE